MNVQRIVIRDRYPVLDREILTRPLNRAVLAGASIALAVQAAALVQVLEGKGKPATPLEHAAFAAVALLWLALGSLVFLQRRARRAGQLFLLSSAAGSVFLSLGTLYEAGFLDSLAFACGLLLFPALLWSFVRAFSEERPWKRRETLIYVPVALLIWPAAQALDARHPTLLWKIAVALVGLYLFAAIAQAYREVRLAGAPYEAAQARALFFGLLAGTLPGTALFLVPIVVTGRLSFVHNTYWLPALVLVFLIAMSYAVLVFELSEAEVIVRRGVVYGAVVLVMLVGYGALGLALNANRASVVSAGGGVSFVAVTIAIGAIFPPLIRLMRRMVDWLLYADTPDRWRTLDALSERLATVMQPSELGETLVRELTRALHLRGALFLVREDGDRFRVQHVARNPRGGSTWPPVPAGFALEETDVLKALGDPPQPLLLVHTRSFTASSRMGVPDAYRPLDEIHAALSFPLIARSGLEAVLCLQTKMAHDAFSTDDLRLLTPIGRQAAAALDNALAFSLLEEMVEELKHAYLRIAHEQEAERARLARELHDGTAQELAALITLATVAERQMGEDGPAHETLHRLRSQAEDAYQGVRRASHALRPVYLEGSSLGPALARYLEGFERDSGIAVRCAAGEVGALPSDVELALFRVAQESMENVRKHSGAHSATVSLNRRNGHVTLSVADDGRGLQHGEPGLGMTTIRERVESLGGSLSLQSEECGVRVEATIPVGDGS